MLSISRSPWLAGLALLASTAGVGPTIAQSASGDTPQLPEAIPVEGFRQLLPRGAIPALVDPEFVPADEAEIPDHAWVLGFAIDDRAFAYDLNLLNHHEVVNHGTEKSRFAAVW